MNRALAVIFVCSFAPQVVSRSTDPVLPQIAAALAVDVRTAALLATAFALPWALSQPVLGPAGDLFGKVRVILAGLFLLMLSALGSAMVSDFTMLMAMRIVAGLASAAVSPVAFALAADLLSPQDRQVGIGRVLTASISGQLAGAVGAGLLGDFFGWRGVYAVGAAIAAVTLVAAVIGFRGVAETRSGAPNLATAMANYRAIFSNPRAKICFSAVFCEGIAVHGILPFVASMLAAAGEPRASVAGLVIAGLATGGLIYSLLVKTIITRFSDRAMMVTGGAMAAAALLLQGQMPPWPVQALALFALGFGFYMLHYVIQVKMLELAPQARGSSVAMHAFFLFVGQAAGPVFYGQALPAAGTAATTTITAAIMLTVGLVCGRYLHGPGRQSGASPQ